MMPSMCAASALSGCAGGGAARQLVGVGQEAVAALLLGENERLARVDIGLLLARQAALRRARLPPR